MRLSYTCSCKVNANESLGTWIRRRTLPFSFVIDRETEDFFVFLASNIPAQECHEHYAHGLQTGGGKVVSTAKSQQSFRQMLISWFIAYVYGSGFAAEWYTEITMPSGPVRCFFGLEYLQGTLHSVTYWRVWFLFDLIELETHLFIANGIENGFSSNCQSHEHSIKAMSVRAPKNSSLQTYRRNISEHSLCIKLVLFCWK